LCFKKILRAKQIDHLENKCHQLVKRLIDSNCKTEFIQKTKEEIQKLSVIISQQFDPSKCDELDKRLNEIKNEIAQAEISRTKGLVSKLIALKSRAENLSQKIANFDTRVLEEINRFLSEENDLDKIESGLQRLDDVIDIEEKEFVREKLKNKCQCLVVKLEAKLSKKLFQLSKALYGDLRNSAYELSNVLNKNTDFDLNYSESKLHELYKSANHGENLILLESLHWDLIERFNQSHCDNEFYKNIRREINLVHERIQTDYEQHNESLKVQMQKIKDDIIFNANKEKIKKESFKTRFLYVKNSISTMQNEWHDQNSREELLAIGKRLYHLEGHITNSSSSSHFEQIESSLLQLENDLNQIKNKIEKRKFSQTDEIKINIAKRLFERWNQLAKIYGEFNYFEQMLNQCQLKLDNKISLDDFYKNINEIINKSNQQFSQQHYHTSNYINEHDKQDLYNILFKS
jgi:hypothetical protein